MGIEQASLNQMVGITAIAGVVVWAQSASRAPKFHFLQQVDYSVSGGSLFGYAKRNDLWALTRSIYRELHARPVEIDGNEVRFEAGGYRIVLLGDASQDKEIGLRIWIYW